MSYNLVSPSDGSLIPVASKGRAEYGASAVRQGTIEIPGQSSQTSQTLSVTFATPMPDANYQVTFKNRYGSSDVLNIEWQTKNGFSFFVYNAATSTTGTHSLDYTAFKLYSDVEYSNIVNSMPSDASASNKLITVADRASFTKTIHTTAKTQSDWHALGTINVSDIPSGNYLVSLKSSPDVQSQNISCLLRLGNSMIAISMNGGTTQMLSCPKVINKGSATTLNVALYLGQGSTIQEGDFVIRFDRVN